jgi:hypothetical protein
MVYCAITLLAQRYCDDRPDATSGLKLLQFVATLLAFYGDFGAAALIDSVHVRRVQTRASSIGVNWLLLTLGFDVVLSCARLDFRSDAVAREFRKLVFARWYVFLTMYMCVCLRTCIFPPF